MDAAQATPSGRTTAAADRRPTMKAIVQDRYGGLETLRYTDIDRPVPTGDEVLVRGSMPPAWTGASGTSWRACRT